MVFTFMTFGAGFLMRPLGAVLPGAYVDRIGRRDLIVTLSIMAFGGACGLMAMLLAHCTGRTRAGVQGVSA